jgi:diapolycopene oxygenase
MALEKVVVVGAGLGGLSAAIALASEGYKVDVYEKNDKVGGKLNVLDVKGFSFDLGPSILTMPHIFEALFTRAGKRMSDYVAIERVKPHWRNFFEDGFVMDLHPEMDLMEKELAKLPGGQDSGFYDFLEYSRKLMKLSEEGYFAKGLDTAGEMMSHHGPGALLAFDMFRSMDGGVRRFIKSAKLRDIMNYFIKYVGSSPYRAPALLNLLAYVQFGYGLWYVKGGMYNMARGLERLAVELGVSIHLNSQVEKIVKQGGAVTGLIIAGGARVAADLIVCNMEVVPAYKTLLDEKKAFVDRLEHRFQPACSGLVLHLGVNKTYPQLAHHNFFYSSDPEHHFERLFKRFELPTDPTIYLVAPCKTDPGQAPAGCEIIKALPHIPHLSDGHEYTMKDYTALRDVVLDKLERMGLTDLRKHIVVEDMWTPLDIKARYLSNRGSIYGVVSDRFRNLGFKAPKQSTLYRNLYFVGGSVNPGGGMPMVSLSGQQVRDKIVKMRMVSGINRTD